MRNGLFRSVFLEVKNKDVLVQVWSLSVQGEPSPAAQGQLGGCRKVLAQVGQLGGTSIQAAWSKRRKEGKKKM